MAGSSIGSAQYVFQFFFTFCVGVPAPRFLCLIFFGSEYLFSLNKQMTTRSVYPSMGGFSCGTRGSIRLF